MNPNDVLSILPDHKDQAMSMREIAEALGLDTDLNTDRRRTRQRLARVLRVLVKWGQASCETREKDMHRCNVYWKTIDGVNDTTNNRFQDL